MNMADGTSAPKTGSADKLPAGDAVSEGTQRHLDALEKGYIGDNPAAIAIPNRRYALTTGPDGVPTHEELAIASAVHARDLEVEYGDGTGDAVKDAVANVKGKGV